MTANNHLPLRTIAGRICVHRGCVMAEQFFNGKVPERSDFGGVIVDEFVNGVTDKGIWSFMTREEFTIHGKGLGPGKGYRYRKLRDGRWLELPYA